MMTENDIAAIERACGRLIIDLTWSVDHHEAAAATQLFTDDGVWIRGGKTLHGHDDIRSSFAGTEALAIRHVVSNIRVTVTAEDAADAVSYYVLYRHDPDTTPTPLPVPMQLPFSMGEWHDRFERRGGQWRFVHREVKRIFQRS